MNSIDEKIKPGRWLYGVAVVIFFIGISALGAFLYVNISGITESGKQVVVPGKSDIFLDGPGNYTIFHEYRSVVNNKVYSTNSDISGLKCFLKDRSTNSEIKLSLPAGNSTYTIGGREGRSILEFRIEKSGPYELSAYYEGISNGPEIVLAVEKNFMGKIFMLVLGALAILFFTIAAGVSIIVITIIKRENYRKNMRKDMTSR